MYVYRPPPDSASSSARYPGCRRREPPPRVEILGKPPARPRLGRCRPPATAPRPAPLPWGLYAIAELNAKYFTDGSAQAFGSPEIQLIMPNLILEACSFPADRT